MQQVLNGRERTQAFLKFLLFFAITVLVIIFAIFFDFHMPTRENSILKDEVYTQRRQEANQQQFVNHMQRAVLLLDSMDKNKAAVTQLSAQFKSQIDDMTKLQEKSSSLYNQMNQTIINGLSELENVKGEKIQLEAQVNKYKEDLQNCNNDKQQLQTQAQLSAPRTY